MKFKNLFIILSLFKALICGVSPITSTYDDANNYVTGMGNRPVLVGNDDQAIVVDSFTSASNAKRINGHSDVYTVDENGYIYYASYTSSSLSCSKTSFNINPITTAMTYYGGKLYIGDNNGILWVFNANNLNANLVTSLDWAFNAGSAITGGIAVNSDGTVYFGTVDAHLYATNNNVEEE